MASKKSRRLQTKTESEKQETDLAERLYKQAAEMNNDENLLNFRVLSGDPEAQYNLAQSYLIQGDTEEDIKTGMFWLSESSRLGYKNAQIMHALYLQCLAEKGNAQYQYQLANLYENGNTIKTDTEKALHWYKKAANQKLPEAMFKLAVCYLEGKITPSNQTLAINLAIEAANLGHAYSSLLVGLYFIQKNNITEAISHFKTAAAGDIKIASTILDTLQSYNIYQDPEISINPDLIDNLKASCFGDAIDFSGLNSC